MRAQEFIIENKVATTPRLQRVMSLLRAKHPQANSDLEALAFELLDSQRDDRRDISRLDVENDMEEMDIEQLQAALDRLQKKQSYK